MSRRDFSLPRPEEPTAPVWALTYADMLSVLLVFFVLLISYSNMDLARYRAMAASLKQAFGAGAPESADPSLGASSDRGIAPGATGARLGVEKDLANLVRKFGPGGPIQILYSPEGVRLRIAGGILFEPGTTAVRAQSLSLLADLSRILARYPYQIWVEGHTDDLPIKSPVYPSNWELSAARAGSVVRDLISDGVPPERLTAVGYADTKPVSPNDDAAGRARNRRVELLLSRSAAGP